MRDVGSGLPASVSGLGQRPQGLGQQIDQRAAEHFGETHERVQARISCYT